MSHYEQVRQILRQKRAELECVAIQVETLRWIAKQETRERDLTSQLFGMFIAIAFLGLMIGFMLSPK